MNKKLKIRTKRKIGGLNKTKKKKTVRFSDINEIFYNSGVKYEKLMDEDDVLGINPYKILEEEKSIIEKETNIIENKKTGFFETLVFETKPKKFIFDNDLCEKIAQSKTTGIPSQVPKLMKNITSKKRSTNLGNNKSIKLRR